LWACFEQRLGVNNLVVDSASTQVNRRRHAKTDVIPAQVSTLVIPAQASLIVIPAQVSALVIPAQAGIQSGGGLDPGFRRGRLWLSPG